MKFQVLSCLAPLLGSVACSGFYPASPYSRSIGHVSRRATQLPNASSVLSVSNGRSQTSSGPNTASNILVLEFWDDGKQKCGPSYAPCVPPRIRCTPRPDVLCAPNSECPGACELPGDEKPEQLCGSRGLSPCPAGLTCVWPDGTNNSVDRPGRCRRQGHN